jgi:PEP-CTERM motif
LQTQSTEYGQSHALTSITTVPEPASLPMLGAGSLLLLGWWRMRATRT